MGQIRDTQVIKVPPVVFAPEDDPPRDLVDFEWGTGIDERGRPVLDGFHEEGETYDNVITEPVDDDPAKGKVTDKKKKKKKDDKKDPPGINPPGNIHVVKQTVRFTADGKQVVDVIIGWDEKKNALGYEVRTSKA